MKTQRIKAEVNTGSMADIAFLLLIFFLVTTQIINDKGIQMRLPPMVDESPVPINERNILKIQINSQNEMMLEGKPFTNLSLLQGKVSEFVLNNGKSDQLSDSPKDAVVSIKTDRGTDYNRFIEVLDEVHAAYYTMRGNKVGLNSAQFRKLDKKDPRDRILYDKGREGLPMQISIAEPSNALNAQ